MRLFTSSSEDGKRRGADYIRFSLIALVVSAVLLAGFEVFLRANGGTPDLNTSDDRWARARQSLEWDHDPASIALLGTSRMQANIDLDVLSEAAGGAQVHQLAVPGESPYYAFKDIAEASGFSGLVVLSFSPSMIAPGPFRNEMGRIVEHYHREWNIVQHARTVIGDTVSSRLAFRNNDFSPDKMLRGFRDTGMLVIPSHRVTDYYRETTYDYRGVPEFVISGRQRNTLSWASGVIESQDADSAADWQTEVVDQFAIWTRMIEDRGGRVVFVYMPSGADIAALEEAKYPRAIYWAPFGALSSGGSIDTKDWPEVAGYVLTDGSHLDAEFKVPFTRLLAAELDKRGLINK